MIVFISLLLTAVSSIKSQTPIGRLSLYGGGRNDMVSDIVYGKDHVFLIGKTASHDMPLLVNPGKNPSEEWPARFITRLPQGGQMGWTRYCDSSIGSAFGAYLASEGKLVLAVMRFTDAGEAEGQNNLFGRQKEFGVYTFDRAGTREVIVPVDTLFAFDNVSSATNGSSFAVAVPVINRQFKLLDPNGHNPFLDSVYYRLFILDSNACTITRVNLNWTARTNLIDIAWWNDSTLALFTVKNVEPSAVEIVPSENLEFARKDVEMVLLDLQGNMISRRSILTNISGYIRQIHLNRSKDVLIVGASDVVKTRDSTCRCQKVVSSREYLMVLDSLGFTHWTKNVHLENGASIRSSYFDDMGRVVLCGDTRNGFNECEDNFPESAKGTNMAFILAYDTDGACLYKKYLDSRGHDKAFRVASDNNGRFYVAGISSVAREIAPDLPRTLSGPCKSLDCFLYEFELPSVSRKP